MTNDVDVDKKLSNEFANARRVDAGAVPAFGPMLERARAAAAQQPLMPAFAPGVARRWRPVRVLAWGSPVLVAAGLGALFVIPDRLKDQEFDRAVQEWSRTQAILRSPTDGLLAVPGSEYLGGIPSLARPATRRGL